MSRIFHCLSLSLALLALIAVSAREKAGGEDTPSEHHDLRSRKLILVKVCCLILIFLATFAGGVSPYFMKWSEGFLALGTQFAGGVFLGTALMHFLSDANEKFGDLTSKEYPFAYMLACAGYMLTMLADSAISYAYSPVDGTQCHAHSGLELSAALQAKNSSIGRTTELNSLELNGESAQSSDRLRTTVASIADSVFLIVALCFHSVFEGIAIGIAETPVDAWRALWTISLHKVFAAVAMGIALLQMIPDRPLLSCAVYAFAFAISSPVGVAIGIVIDATTQGAVADWIFAICMGLACGVFVYVSINQLLSKRYVGGRDGAAPLAKFLAVLLGVGVIGVVMIWDT